jgi:threonine/homoserine/homoserine lactone efflux protein
MKLDTWVAFVILETALCFTPGPAVLYVVSTALGRGSRAALGGALGIVACNAFYFALSALGVAAVFIELAVLAFYTWVASRAGAFAGRRFRTLLERVAGALLIAAGARLALERSP